MDLLVMAFPVSMLCFKIHDRHKYRNEKYPGTSIPKHLFLNPGDFLRRSIKSGYFPVQIDGKKTPSATLSKICADNTLSWFISLNLPLNMSLSYFTKKISFGGRNLFVF
jgi:hypothetical protein